MASLHARDLDAVRQRDREQEEQSEMAATVLRIRNNRALYQPFVEPPEVQRWLALFQVDALRYPLLILLGASGSGKTEFAVSRFRNALQLRIGSLTQFPDGFRFFDRQRHDGIVLDDIRDLKFLTDHQDQLQGKYNAMMEFGTTPGGTCAYSLWFFRVPIVATINYSTEHLDYLESHDWLGKTQNRILMQFPAPTCYPGV